MPLGHQWTSGHCLSSPGAVFGHPPTGAGLPTNGAIEATAHYPPRHCRHLPTDRHQPAPVAKYPPGAMRKRSTVVSYGTNRHQRTTSGRQQPTNQMSVAYQPDLATSYQLRTCRHCRPIECLEPRATDRERMLDREPEWVPAVVGVAWEDWVERVDVVDRRRGSEAATGTPTGTVASESCAPSFWPCDVSARRTVSGMYWWTSFSIAAILSSALCAWEGRGMALLMWGQEQSPP